MGPLRYVNGARTPSQKKQVNVKAKQLGEKVHFFTTKRVNVGDELLIDYGPQYFEGLRYQTRLGEYRREILRVKSALRSLPRSAKSKRESLEASLEILTWKIDDLDAGSDAESDY